MGKYDKVTINGETKTLWDWSLECGVNYLTLRARLDHGCPADRLLLPPNKFKPLTARLKGYTEEELYRIYLKFADSPHAMELLADFAGAPSPAFIKPLYLKFRDRRKSGEVK